MMKLFWFALQWNFQWGVLRRHYGIALREIWDCIVEGVVNVVLVPLAMLQVIFIPLIAVISAAWTVSTNPVGVKKLMAQKQKWDEEND